MSQFEDLRQLGLEHTWIPIRPWNVMVEPDGFNIFMEGKGCKVTDIYGRTYIDYWSAMGNVLSLGYSRKEIADAAYKQMLNLPFRPTHELSVPQIELAKKLADITPGTLSRVFFGSSGTEAIETAIKIARKYKQLLGFPNGYKIIVGGYRYHGSTYGAMSLGHALRVTSWEDYETMLPGVVHALSPPCFCCDLGLKYPACEIQCVKVTESIIQQEMPETIAAFLDVPIPTENSTAPPPEYWPMVRSICDKYGILLIDDEVMLGFGRTGKMFACEHWNVVPDIMAVSKSIAGGYLPLSATIVTKEVAQKFEGGRKEMLSHSYTFDGHPVACAAALVTIEIIERENLVENSKIMGKYLFDNLQSLHKYRTIGEIRGGLGLDCCIEFVKNRESGEAFSPEENTKFITTLKKRLRQAGLWGPVGNPLSFKPALTITEDEVDEIVTGVDRAVGETEKEFGT